ncbi:hypothetical protein [Naasia aerilata]|uniref:Uncharacterized protein n=1 Tax=Naasia aerilata TaxID=1162966 RepID=A0ABN6XM64_9MICO|nr:hypothetical protein [Naasia aerilata]BDZ46072.1 hypothetical protein GCM10025866_19810 [Naasia aerilata]
MSDPFDPVPVEDKVDAYRSSLPPEPDEERPVAEPVDDPEAPLDSGDDLLADDWDAGAPAERPDPE